MKLAETIRQFPSCRVISADSTAPIRPEAAALDSGDYPVIPQEWLEIVDGGRDYAGGKPPAIIAATKLAG